MGLIEKFSIGPRVRQCDFISCANADICLVVAERVTQIQRAQSRVITSSKCRPRNTAGPF